MAEAMAAPKKFWEEAKKRKKRKKEKEKEYIYIYIWGNYLFPL
jgi:hypothetical protein